LRKFGLFDVELINYKTTPREQIIYREKTDEPAIKNYSITNG
jgi:hypothetical protein